MIQSAINWFLGELQPLSSGQPQAGCGTGTDITSPYSGARVTKLNSHWIPNHFSGNDAIGESWELLTARIRDRVRNDAVLSKCKATLSRLCVGSGIRTFSSASDLLEENQDLVKFEIESDTWFDRWALEEADATAEHSLWDMQRIAFEDEVESGNSLWLEVLLNDPGRTLPLAYQLLEYEQIDRSKDRDPSVSRSGKGRKYNRISGGIEYDARGRKVAYHIFDAHPYDSSTGWSSRSRRIPANRVVHQYYPHRPSATIGVSWFAPNLQTNQDLDRYVANELTTRALTALMGVAIKTNDNANFGLDAEDPDTGVPAFKLGYPFIGTLAKDDEVEVVETKRDNNEGTSLINLLLNLQAMGCRISLNRLMGDPSQANLASIKAAHQDDDAMIAPVRDNLSRRCVLPIRKRHNEMAFANGLYSTFSARDFARQQWRFSGFDVIAGSSAAMDTDATEASMNRMRSGLSTYPEETAKLGNHWRRNLRRMKVVNDVAEDMGVVLDWTKGQGMVPDSATSIAGDEQKKEGSDASQQRA